MINVVVVGVPTLIGDKFINPYTISLTNLQANRTYNLTIRASNPFGSVQPITNSFQTNIIARMTVTLVSVTVFSQSYTYTASNTSYLTYTVGTTTNIVTSSPFSVLQSADCFIL
jgi:hypothetical protein